MVTDKKTKALKLALEALSCVKDMVGHPDNIEFIDSKIAAIREALADSALDRMAENARELGLDYEPIVEQVEDSVGMGHGAWDMVEPKKLAKAFHEALAEQPAQQQEPVAKWMGDCIEWTENPYKFRKGTSIYTAPQPLPRDYTTLERALTRLQKRYADLESGVGKPTGVKPWVGLVHEETHEAIGTAGADLLELAKLWSDNKVHVYQFDNEARKIIEAVLRRASAKLREKNNG